MRGYRADIAFDGERILPAGALVLVEDATIAAVEAGSAPAPDGCEVTYLPGTTLLPGLIDTHVHLCGDGGPRALDQLPELSADDLDAIISASLQAQLAAGVTAVRDLGDHQWAVVERRTHAAEDEPTIVAAGPPITIEGGHCWSMGGVVTGIEGLRRAVRERAKRGANIVKIMTSGGAMTVGTDVTACQFTLEELRAAVDEAHSVGLPITAHAHGVPAVEQCLDAEVDGIEHCSCLTPTGFHTPPELANRLAASGILVCPTLGRTLGVAEPPQIKALMERTGITWEQRLEQVRPLYDAGVVLISGADAGINPGKAHGVLTEAIIDLLASDVPADVALVSATSLAAQACGLATRTGRLRAGHDADVLIVDGDATVDLTALRNVRTVVSRGREVKSLRESGPLRRPGEPTRHLDGAGLVAFAQHAQHDAISYPTAITASTFSRAAPTDSSTATAATRRRKVAQQQGG